MIFEAEIGKGWSGDMAIDDVRTVAGACGRTKCAELLYPSQFCDRILDCEDRYSSLSGRLADFLPFYLSFIFLSVCLFSFILFCICRCICRYACPPYFLDATGISIRGSVRPQVRRHVCQNRRFRARQWHLLVVYPALISLFLSFWQSVYLSVGWPVSLPSCLS